MVMPQLQQNLKKLNRPVTVFYTAVFWSHDISQVSTNFPRLRLEISVSIGNKLYLYAPGTNLAGRITLSVLIYHVRV